MGDGFYFKTKQSKPWALGARVARSVVKFCFCFFLFFVLIFPLEIIIIIIILLLYCGVVGVGVTFVSLALGFIGGFEKKKRLLTYY